MYLNGLLFVVTSVIVLNVLYQLATLIYNQGLGTTKIIHIGQLIESSNGFIYLWLDTLVALFLFGFSFLIASITFRFGLTKSLVGATILLLALVIWVTFADITPLIDFIVSNTFTFFQVIGLIGVVAFVATYPIMINAPLTSARER